MSKLLEIEAAAEALPRMTPANDKRMLEENV